MSNFRILPLDPAPFAALFDLPDDELRRRGIHRRIADAPGLPCRVSLEDSPAGSELLLLPFEHLPVDSPYRASGPIFVRRDAKPAQLEPGVVPPYVTSRLISVRAYDGEDMMIDAAVVEGTEVQGAIERMFGDPQVRYLHLHNAKRGCFSCQVVRA